jgi:hypothetical protein
MAKTKTAPVRTKRTKTRRNPAGSDESKYQSPAEIVQFWLDSINGALKSSDKDELSEAIVEHYRPILEGFVANHIGKNHKFTKTDENNTKRVARDLGTICKIVTTKSHAIEMETFDLAFTFVQLRHDVCRHILGPNRIKFGAWCGGA